MPIPSSPVDPFSDAYLADPLPAQAALRDLGPVVRPPSLVLETDPPLHDRTRAVQSRVLAPAAIARLRPRFTEVAEALLDRLIARGEIDAVADLAEAYPLAVFPEAMGMPEENRRFLLPWGNMLFNSFGPRNAIFEDAVREAAPVIDWVHAQSQRTALSPHGFGAQIHAAADRGELTPEETPQVVRSVLTAGVDPTVSAIGAAIHCLASFPDQYASLRANRDPRRWENPDAYDISRRTVGHVGFGSGVHACVGMALARLEGECVLAALAARVARIEPSGEPRRRRNNTLRAFAHLPVRLVPA